MQLDFEQTLNPYFGAQQSMKVSPRLVAANYILELSSQELQQAIATGQSRQRSSRTASSSNDPTNLQALTLTPHDRLIHRP